MKPAPPVTRARKEQDRSLRAGRTLLARWYRRRVAPTESKTGLFVTLEGIDRSGKTTQSRLLCEALGDDALAVREPGGTPAGERVRDLLKDPEATIGPAAEALLFAAARAQLVSDVIRPALEAGRVVVSDRFLDSSLAYQGSARGLGVDEVAQLNAFATGGLAPRHHLPARTRSGPRGGAGRRGRPLRG